MKRLNGFTLIEVLIALSLMTVITVTSTQVFRNTTERSQKITSTLDEFNRTRSALSIMNNDFAKAFHYRDIMRFLYSEAQKSRVKNYDKKLKKWAEDYNKENQPTPPITLPLIDTHQALAEENVGPKPKAKPLPKETIVTHFVGESDKVYFTTSSGVRFRAEDKVSNLIEVGFFVESCKSRHPPHEDTECLWRSLSYNLDGEVEEGGKPHILIEGVEEVEFAYLGYSQSDEPEWLDRWNSTEVSDNRFGELFPQAVSLKIKIKFARKNTKKKKQTQNMYAVFPIYFPNNKPLKRLKSTSSKSKTNQAETNQTTEDKGPETQNENL